MHDEDRRTTWSAYQAAWADTTAADRTRLLDQSLADGCVYSDPDGVWEGRNAITGRIERFRSGMPGTVFRNHAYLFHHGWSLAHWALYDANGAEMVPGASVAEYGPDGRIVRVTGFFPAPAVPASARP